MELANGKGQVLDDEFAAIETLAVPTTQDHHAVPALNESASIDGVVRVAIGHFLCEAFEQLQHCFDSIGEVIVCGVAFIDRFDGEHAVQVGHDLVVTCCGKS